jgi:hypothetical protein
MMGLTPGRLNMRTTIGIYRQLGAFLDDADTTWTETHSTPSQSSSSLDSITPPMPMEDPNIDPHFRSGVYLGVGMCNIILSLMPGKLATLVELFGYKGDRKLGLEMLMKAGGWVDREAEPQISTSWFSSSSVALHSVNSAPSYSHRGCPAFHLRHVSPYIPPRPLLVHL